MRTWSTWSVLVLVVSGCSAAHSTPTVALQGQSAVVVTRDTEDCERAAARQPEASRVYAACMITRGYQAYVPVMLAAQYDVRAARAVPALEGAVQDLAACHARAEAAQRWENLPVRVQAGIGAPWPANMAAQQELVALLDRAYIGCMADRGYVATRWHAR